MSTHTKGIGSLQRIKNTVYFQTNNLFFKYSLGQDLFFEDHKMSALFHKINKIDALAEDNYGNIWYIFKESIGVLMQNSNGKYENIVTPFTSLTGNLVQNYLSVNTIDPQNILIGLTDGLAHYNQIT